jgi:hypothetical protein
LALPIAVVRQPEENSHQLALNFRPCGRSLPLPAVNR